MNRRDFLSAAGMLAAAGTLPGLASACTGTTLNNKGIPTQYDTDILIAGGGPAGVCAAIAAARMGARVLIVETGNCLGGMATKGLVSPFMTCYDSAGEQMIIRGIFEEILDRMVARGGALHPRDIRHTTPYSAWITAGHDHCTPFEAECMKLVLDEMVAEAGVEVLFHSQFVSPILKGKNLKGAVLLTRKGLEGVSAQVVIDATGDGDVAFRSGVPCEFGNEALGKVQPCTMFFHMNNVDSARLEADVQAHLHEFRKVDGVSYRALHWRVAEAEAAGKWDIARKSVNIYKCVQDDEWAVNCSRLPNVDSTDPASLSAAESTGRKQVDALMDFFHTFVPGCENATLMCSGSIVGIRESRHARGEHVLTAEELIESIVPEDSILVASNSVDVHGGGKSALSTTYTTIKGKWYGVPYRCLVPVEVDGLLLAGRCLSATSDAAGAVRVMPPAMAMGHAAGVAAALAVRNRITPREVDPEAVRRELLAQKAFLG